MDIYIILLYVVCDIRCVMCAIYAVETHSKTAVKNIYIYISKRSRPIRDRENGIKIVPFPFARAN